MNNKSINQVARAVLPKGKCNVLLCDISCGLSHKDGQRLAMDTRVPQLARCFKFDLTLAMKIKKYSILQLPCYNNIMI